MGYIIGFLALAFINYLIAIIFPDGVYEAICIALDSMVIIYNLKSTFKEYSISLKNDDND